MADELLSSSSSSSRITHLMLLVGVLLPIGMSLYLLHLNGQLRKNFGATLASQTLKRGDYFPMLPMRPVFTDASAEISQVSEHPVTLVYIFATTCKYCEKQSPTLPDVVAVAKEFGYKFAALSTDDQKRTAAIYRTPPPYPVAFVEQGDVFRNTRIAGTPTFVLLNDSGRVLQVHVGTLTTGSFAQLFSPHALAALDLQSAPIPRLSSLKMPSLTPAAEAAHYVGDVAASVMVDENGTPGDIRLNKIVGYGLDQEAISAIRNAVFLPAVRGGKPVRAQITLMLHFVSPVCGTNCQP